MIIAGLVYGNRYPEQWGSTAQPTDFFDVKADVMALISLTGQHDGTIFTATRHPALHPGQSAAITRGDMRLGTMGALHPEIKEKQGITGQVYLFELSLGLLSEGSLPVFAPLSRFPSVRRDIAVVLDEAVPAQEVQMAVKNVAGDVLTKLQLFDVYTGKGIDLGKKSLALGLTFQESSRTLTDSEVDDLLGRVILHLQDSYGATLRD